MTLVAWGRRRAAPTLPADLRHIDGALLCAVCDQPRPAHEVVSRYRMRAQEPATDMEVILALQWLVSMSALVVGRRSLVAAASMSEEPASTRGPHGRNPVSACLR
jgi:hypothetical protein